MRKPAPLVRWRTVPHLHADEDLSSFVVRLAGYGAVTPRQLYRHYLGLGTEIADLPWRPLIVARVNTICGYDEGLVQPLTWIPKANRTVEFRSRRYPETWVSAGRRVAPGVLASDGAEPYCRLAWRFPAFACDLHTGEALIGRCPSCEVVLSWKWPDKVYRCQRCNFDIRRAKPIQLPADMWASAKKLASFIGLLPVEGFPKVLPPPFTSTDFLVTVRILEWCGRFAGMMRKDMAAATVMNAALGLETALAWPAPLEMAMDLLFRQDRRERVEVTFFKEVVSGLPASIQKAFMAQVAEIAGRPEFRERERYVPRNPRRPVYIKNATRVT